MKYSKKDVETAILYFAEKYGKLDAFEYMLRESVLPSIINMIIKEMFLQEFFPQSSEKDELNMYQIILVYSKELNKIGYVLFDEK